MQLLPGTLCYAGPTDDSVVMVYVPVGCADGPGSQRALWVAPDVVMQGSGQILATSPTAQRSSALWSA
jgi:hypothetical protein